MIKFERMRSCFLWIGKEEQFLEMQSTPGEDAMKIVKTTTKVLEYDINLVYKAMACFERTDSNSERNSTVDKMLSNSNTWYKEIVCERKSQWM